MNAVGLAWGRSHLYQTTGSLEGQALHGFQPPSVTGSRRNAAQLRGGIRLFIRKDMNRVCIALAILSLIGCAMNAAPRRIPQALAVPAGIPSPEVFIAVPSRIDTIIDVASIEDYIIALPKFAYHEETEKMFWQRVRTARKVYAENHGKGSDFLFVGGDGCWPAKDFTLDRRSKTLTIRIYEWEPGRDATITVHTMRRVPGGWMRGRWQPAHGGTAS